jgi:hypothetical protein
MALVVPVVPILPKVGTAVTAMADRPTWFQIHFENGLPIIEAQNLEAVVEVSNHGGLRVKFEQIEARASAWPSIKLIWELVKAALQGASIYF